MNESFKVYWTERFIMVFGENLNTETHKHHAMQISIGLENEISVDCNKQKGDIIVINSNIEHCVKEQSISVMILVYSETTDAKILRNCLKTKDYIVENNNNLSTLNKLKNLWNYESTIEKAKEAYFDVIADIMNRNEVNKTLLNKIINFEIDERILESIIIIKTSDISTIKLSTLASAVFLSESRFQHLFLENIGVSLTKYLLWMKTLYAVKGIVNGLSFTRAAIDAGFSDGAHFSRTVKKTFGLTMTEAFKNSRFIQVISDVN